MKHIAGIRRSRAYEFAFALSVVGVVGGVKHHFYATLGQHTPVLLFLGALIVVASVTSRGPALVAAIAATIGINVFLMSPLGSVSTSPERILQTLIFGAEALWAVSFTTKLRAAKVTAEAATARIERLHAVTFALIDASTAEESGRVVARECVKTFGARFAGAYILTPSAPVLLANEGSLVSEHRHAFLASVTQLVIKSGASRQTLWVECEREIAALCRDDEVAPAVSAGMLIILPADVSGDTAGVLVLGFSSPHALQPGDRPLLEIVAREYVHALHRSKLLEIERDARALADVARTDAQAANRVKDEVLGVVSHELRTPLHAIIGWTQLLEQSNEAHGDKLKDGLQSIRRNAEAQNTIINDLMDISKVTTGKLALERDPVDLAAMLHSALDAVEPTAKARKMTLRLRTEPQLTVLGDEERLRQVVLNLVANALKFTPDGGQITIQLRRLGQAACLTVIDTGRGIPAGELSSIFERFYQADANTAKQHRGLGLGLALVKHFVEAHGGQVRADRPGRGCGATFTVELPLESETVHGRLPSVTAGDISVLPLRGIKVLIVDDERDAAGLVGQMLNAKGATVRLACSAREAVCMFDAFSPNIVVSDIGMPGEDGLDLIRRIREMKSPRHAVPAIALTAYGRGEDVRKSRAAGFQCHLTKPVSESKLVDTVHQWARAYPP